jgi:hypothetical protein
MKGSSAKVRWGGLIALLILSILTGGWLLRRKAAPEGTVYQQARLFENVVTSIHTHYIDSLDEGDLYQTAAKALVSSLRNEPAGFFATAARDATGRGGRRHSLGSVPRGVAKVLHGPAAGPENARGAIGVIRLIRDAKLFPETPSL